MIPPFDPRRDGWEHGPQRMVLVGPPGTGKCLGRGTLVLRADGRVVPVELVTPFDRLMGPDGKARTVLSTTVGRGPLFRVVPIKGEPWVCNDVHVLTLVSTDTGKVVDVGLDRWHAAAANFRQRHKLFSVGVEAFEGAPELGIDPYFLGLWFGDGSKEFRALANGSTVLSGVKISKPDPEVRAYCEAMAGAYGLSVSVHGYERNPTLCIGGGTRAVENKLLSAMRAVIGPDVLVPEAVLRGPRHVRLPFLAGFLDADAELTCNCFTISQKREDWARAIHFIARSLGFCATIRTRQARDQNGTEGTYWVVSISGELDAIPNLIPRRQAWARAQAKVATRTGFSVEPLGEGEYFGFTLDGDGRFLLGDFTVTHNTTAIVQALLLPALRELSARDVLAVSFTRAAAGEIGGRVAYQLGGEADDFRRTSSTIHAEARRLALDVLGDLDVTKERRDDVLQGDVDEDDTDEAANQPPAEAKVAPGARRRAARTVWDYARNTLAPGDTPHAQLLAAWRHFSDDQRVARFTPEQLAAEVELYEGAKASSGEIDFTDMLDVALRRGPVPGRELLIVDEAQDCSPLQWALIDRWARHARRVVLVGDWDQAIHGWSGADSTPLLRFAADRGWAARRLATSWRVPREPHRLARALIQRNCDRLDAPYDHAPLERPRGPRQLTGPGSIVELRRREAAERVLEAVRLGRDVFVLARSRQVLAGMVGHLEPLGVPFTAERGYSALGAPTAVAIARAILDLREGRGALVADALVLLDSVPARGHFPGRAEGGKKAVLEEASTWPADARVGLQDLTALGCAFGFVLEGELADALRVARVNRDTTRDRATGIQLVVEAFGREVLDREPLVTLTTMHASKGREADLVVLDLEAPRPVARRLVEGGAEEERRLLYVGVTRTRQDLVLVRCPTAGRDLGHALGLGRVPRPDAGQRPLPYTRETRVLS